ncbi:hypothetical protein [Micromonospora sp. RTP1Z1]|uniref:hypothetical protein n=1 Tax=Micromonospora sp. RTP1Z1 TaxID=2994043 RepID=UPI0029C68E5B|nr:hypothetical protein [Micromonospora sp. RTP1Z1]
MPRSAWNTWFIRSPRSLGNRRPVPLAPRHRRVWRNLGRWCSCGLRWRGCPDRHAGVPTEPVAPPPTPNRPPWADVTMANPQVGRAGRLTLAQSWRANGGRW